MDVQKRVRDLMKLRGWTDYRLAKEAALPYEEQRTLFARWSSLTERQKNLLLDLMETM